MINVLMIGSFLSGKYGTKPISEKLAISLNEPYIKLNLVSFKHAKILRFSDIILSSIFSAYDRMHIDTFSGSAFRIAEAASIIAKWRRKKLILTLHGGKLPEFFKDSAERVKRVFARADYIQTPSLYLKNFFAKQDITVNYLPNSIDLSRFPYSRENVKPQALLWVRAFTEIYNPDLPVWILHEIKKIYPDATLTMVGPDKGLLSETKTLIKKLGLNSSVNITGPVPNDSLYSYYQSHEVFLNTTSYESFGVAVLEAAACGIPVVSSKVGELPYLWKHEEDILMVEKMEPDEFCLAIQRLFNSKDLAEKISMSARKKAEEFDWAKIKAKWVALLT